MVSYPGVKRPERDVNRPPSSSAEDENEWSCTFTPRILPRGLDRESLFNSCTNVGHACVVVFLGFGTAAPTYPVVPGLDVVGGLIIYSLFYSVYRACCTGYCTD